MDGKKGGFLDFLRQNRKEGFVGSQSLKEIEAQLGVLAKLADSLIVVYNFPGVCIDYHRGFDTILGYPRSQEITPEFLLSLLHPEDKPAAEFLALQASQYQNSNGIKVPFQTMIAINFRVRKFDGTYLMMINRSTGFKYTNEITESSLNILQDVSFIPEIDKVRSAIIGDAESTSEHNKKIAGLYVANDRIQHFTAREMDVLKLLANGLPSKKIAEKLFISTHTVNNHRKNMLKRAGLKNSAELIRLALKNGLAQVLYPSFTLFLL